MHKQQRINSVTIKVARTFICETAGNVFQTSPKKLA